MRLFFWALGLLCLIEFVDSGAARHAKITKRFVAAVAGEYPSLAVLDLNGDICTGTLIGPFHILTAAHCLYGDPVTAASTYKVNINTLSTNGSGAESRGVKTFIIHEYYNNATKTNDIALLVLNASVTNIPYTVLPPSVSSSTFRTTRPTTRPCGSFGRCTQWARSSTTTRPITTKPTTTRPTTTRPTTTRRITTRPTRPCGSFGRSTQWARPSTTTRPITTRPTTIRPTTTRPTTTRPTTTRPTTTRRITTRPTRPCGSFGRCTQWARPSTTTRPITTRPTTTKPTTTRRTTTKPTATTKETTTKPTTTKKLTNRDVNTYANMSVVTVGWGTTSAEGNSTLLLKTNVTILDDTVCAEQYGSAFYHILNLCASAEDKAVCQDDGGCPLFVDGVQVGIKSWGKGSEEPESAGIYTRITRYINWIVYTQGNNP